MERYPLYLNGARAGFLTAETRGLYEEYQAVCRPEVPELLRAWLEGERGALALGVLVPEGDVFTIRRRVSRSRTACLGRLKCCRVCSADAPEAHGAESGGEETHTAADGPERMMPEQTPRLPAGWEPERRPERLVSGYFAHFLRPLSGVLTRREGTVRWIAAPLDTAAPFPIPPLFCFARTRCLGGGQYAVFAFDAAGAPVMEPENADFSETENF